MLSVSGSVCACIAVDFINLTVDAAHVIKVTAKKQSCGAEVDDSCNPLAHIKSVYTKVTKEREQNPRDVIVEWPWMKLARCCPSHTGNQNQIDEPADPKEPKGCEPDAAANGSAKIEAMTAGKTEYPQDIPNEW
jgi:hypothetical protein